MTDHGAQPALQLIGVGRQFGGVHAVRQVSFEVAYGERHAVLGPNGAGKSTLFNLIAGEFSPTTGQIILFGQDVTSLKLHQRVRLGLSRTYQTSLLFPHLTTLDNLYLAIRGALPNRMSLLRPKSNDPHQQKAWNLAIRVGLEDHIHAPVALLSHGQQRQLEVGMALAGNPRMILLDEPAAGLSPGERSRLSELLLSLDREITLLIIEHDMDIALQVGEIVTVMHEGDVIATGTPEQIRHNETVHDLYLGARHEH